MTAAKSSRSGVLTIRQVADHFAVGLHIVLCWVRRGELRAVNVGRNPRGRPTWRVPLDALAEFERARAARPAPSQIVCRRRRRETNAEVIQFFR